MNTGTARIVIIVALLVVGGLLLSNAFTDPDTAAAGASPAGETSPTPTDSPTSTKTDSPPVEPEAPKPAKPEDTSVAVFNGTDSVGLAGTVMEDLLAEGYKQGQVPADAPNKPVEQTIVYYVGGADAEQNKANTTALAKKYYPDAKVKELDPEYSDGNLVQNGVQVVVVLGDTDAPAAG